MHSVANLATLQTPLATFPFKKSPKRYLVSENRWYCRASERSCCPSTRTHLSLSLCVSLVQRAHTPLSLSLSVRLLSFCSARAHTSLSLSLCASAQFLFTRAQTGFFSFSKCGGGTILIMCTQRTLQHFYHAMYFRCYNNYKFS